MKSPMHVSYRECVSVAAHRRHHACSVYREFVVCCKGLWKLKKCHCMRVCRTFLFVLLRAQRDKLAHWRVPVRSRIFKQAMHRECKKGANCIQSCEDKDSIPALRNDISFMDLHQSSYSHCEISHEGTEATDCNNKGHR